VQGLEFVASVRRFLPWKGIDAVFAKPPLSTEHILHPDSYKSYERPDEVASGPLKGLTLLSENVNGELGLQLLLRQHGVKKSRVETATVGWGGDRVALFTNASPASLATTTGVGYTVWDSEGDADEFLEAVGDALAVIAGGAVSKTLDERVLITGGKVPAAAARRGDVVVYVVGGESALVDEVLTSFAVTRR
jgi:hypothetical protein